MIGILFWSSVALVAYTYAGYPLLLWAVAGWRTPQSHPDHRPAVTLIIAAHNEEDVIDRKLSDVASLDYPPIQVIVAADGSDDATARIAASHHGVEVLHRPERLGKSAAISRALDHATGEVIVFSDANNRFAPDALAALVRPFGDPEIAVVTGNKRVTGPDGLGFSEGAYWRYEAFIRRMETRLGTCVGVNGEILAVRRTDLAAPPPGIVNDDAWMAHSAIAAGKRVVFAEDAVSTEPVSADAAGERERRTRMAAGVWQMLSTLPGAIPWRRPVVAWSVVSHKLFRYLVPFGMVGALTASVFAVLSPGSGILGLGRPWNWASLGAQVAFYALAAAGSRLGGAGYAPRFLVSSNISALRGLWRHLAGRQDAAWDRVARATEPV